MLLLVQMMQSLTISLDACTALPVRRSHQGSSDFGWKLGFIDLIGLKSSTSYCGNVKLMVDRPRIRISQSRQSYAPAILPLYMVLEASASMQFNGGIDIINDTIPELWAEFINDPIKNDIARVGIIVFSDTASVVQPLIQPSNADEIPGVAAQGSTSYAAAFRCLLDTIRTDIPNLKAQGRVLRPTVFFITDGEPDNEDWRTPFNELMADPYHPNMFAFGIEGADRDTIKELGTGGAFIAVDNVTASKALASVFKSIGRTVVASARAGTEIEIEIETESEGKIVLEEL